MATHLVARVTSAHERTEDGHAHGEGDTHRYVVRGQRSRAAPGTASGLDPEHSPCSSVDGVSRITCSTDDLFVTWVSNLTWRSL